MARSSINEHGLTPKQEAFVQRYLTNGENGADAYREVYKPKGKTDVYAEASRLLDNRKVAARLVQLKQKVAKKYEITAESVMLELDELVQMAKMTGQLSPAVSALLGKAKIAGLIVDKQRHVDKDDRDVGATDAAILAKYGLKPRERD